MPDRKEIITQYRHFISSRYSIYGWIAGLIWFSGVFLRAWLDSGPWLSYVTSCMIGLGLGFLWYLVHHRSQMLYYFNPVFHDPFEQLEKYLGIKKKRWDQTQWLRLGIMAVLAITMLYLLFFAKESKWAGISASLFLTLILAFIVKGWLDFNDEILLHDIRRSFRDQVSD